MSISEVREGLVSFLQGAPISLEFFISTIVAVFLAVVGWVIGHRLNANRDIKNKQRELRIQYLVEAYHTFVELGRNVDILSNYKDVERAIYFIHLFGAPSIIDLCDKFVEELTGSKRADQTKLVVEIRNLIRRDLGMEDVGHGIKFLKITPVHPVEDESVS